VSSFNDTFALYTKIATQVHINKMKVLKRCNLKTCNLKTFGQNKIEIIANTVN